MPEAPTSKSGGTLKQPGQPSQLWVRHGFPQRGAVKLIANTFPIHVIFVLLVLILFWEMVSLPPG